MSDPEDHDDREQSSRSYTEERRRERLPPQEGDTDSEPFNPTWRSQRLNRGTGRRPMIGGLPSSPQEVTVWLQGGGWRWLAAIGAIFVLALIFILLSRSPRQVVQTTEGLASTSAAVTTGDRTPLLQSTVTVPPQPTTPPPAPAAFIVTGTDTDGLFLRSDHSTDAPVLETLPDGTRIERIGDDFTGSDRVWRNVRAPSGKEGWVAADYVQAAP